MMMNLPETQKTWATPGEVADYLSVSTRTVYRLAETGDLVAMRVRNALRIKVESIRRFEDKQMQRFFIEKP